jgi:hypothetical protein
MAESTVVRSFKRVEAFKANQRASQIFVICKEVRTPEVEENPGPPLR